MSYYPRAAADAKYVDAAGDAMTGALTLAGDPSNPLEAVPKQYADSMTATAPVRQTASLTTATIAPDATATGTIDLGDGYRLYTITTSSSCRTRLYTTIDKRTADASRVIGVDPVGDHGLILEYVSSSSDPTLLSADLSPLVDGFDGDADGLVPYAVTNTGTSTTPITVTFSYLRTEG